MSKPREVRMHAELSPQTEIPGTLIPNAERYLRAVVLAYPERIGFCIRECM